MGWGNRRKVGRKHPKTCARCPHVDTSTGCPCWIDESMGLIETNLQTGEERLLTGCFYEIIPKLMVHVIRASNRPAAAMESFRNEVVTGLGNIVHAFQGKPVVVTRLIEGEGKEDG